VFDPSTSEKDDEETSAMTTPSRRVEPGGGWC
jgi:hypothetical protein